MHICLRFLRILPFLFLLTAVGLVGCTPETDDDDATGDDDDVTGDDDDSTGDDDDSTGDDDDSTGDDDDSAGDDDDAAPRVTVISVTGGGGTVQGSGKTAHIAVGPPQPTGKAQGSDKELTLGPLPAPQ